MEHSNGSAGRVRGGAGAEPPESATEIPDHQAVLTQVNISPKVRLQNVSFFPFFPFIKQSVSDGENTFFSVVFMFYQFCLFNQNIKISNFLTLHLLLQ